MGIKKIKKIKKRNEKNLKNVYCSIPLIYQGFMRVVLGLSLKNEKTYLTITEKGV